LAIRARLLTDNSNRLLFIVIRGCRDLVEALVEALAPIEI
jgi:hypothetical protein